MAKWFQATRSTLGGAHRSKASRCSALGDFLFESLERRVLLSSADGSGPDALATVDDPEFTVVSGYWRTHEDVRYTATGDGSSKVRWTFERIEPGLYQVATTWIEHANRASDATYSLLDGLGDTDAEQVAVNQEHAPDDFTDAKVDWEVLADAFHVSGDTLVIELTDAADEWVIAGSICIKRVGDLIETTDPGFEVVTGYWSTASSPIGDVRYRSAGTGSRSAQWTVAGLEAGLYRVAATWVPHANRATDAPYSLMNGLGDPNPLTIDVNQELAPDDFAAHGYTWETLADGFAVTGDTLVVELTDDANEYVIAGPIYVERIGDLPSASSSTANTTSPVLGLDPASDTGLVGDGVTEHATVNLVGNTTPHATVEIIDQSLTLEDFESYAFEQNVEDDPPSKPWSIRRGGFVVHGHLNITPINSWRALSGAKSARLGLNWYSDYNGPNGHVDAVYELGAPTDLSLHLESSVLMRSDNAAFRVKLLVSNGSTHYVSNDWIDLSGASREIVFNLSDAYMSPSYGSDTFAKLIQEVTHIGFRFGSTATGHGEVNFDSFQLPSIPPMVTTADASGQFRFNAVPLAVGTSEIRTIATDTGGDEIQATSAINRVLPLQIEAVLQTDTGASSSDGITSDPTIAGNFSGAAPTHLIYAGLDAMPRDSFSEVWSDARILGNFTMDRAQFDALAGGILEDGPHTLHLIVSDADGNVSDQFDLDFVLDTSVSPLLDFGLDPSSDTGTIGDKQTDAPIITLTGLTEPGANIELLATPRFPIDNFESYTIKWVPFSNNMGYAPPTPAHFEIDDIDRASGPWRHAGPATLSQIELTAHTSNRLVGRGEISDHASAQYALSWPAGSGFDRSYGTAEFVLGAPTDLTGHFEAVVNMRSVLESAFPATQTHVRLIISDGQSTYQSSVPKLVSSSVQDLTFGLTVDLMESLDGPGRHVDVLANAETIGFRFASAEGEYDETIVFDDFELLSGVPAMSTTADSSRTFSFSNIVLPPGTTELTVEATDVAGNRVTVSETFVRAGTSPADPLIQQADGVGFEVVNGYWSSVNTPTGVIRFAPPGDGSRLVRWEFSGLTPGLYTVAATWAPHVNRATDAPYSIFDGADDTSPHQATANQEQAPDDFVDAGREWEFFDGAFAVTGDTLIVELTNDADEWVIADAIRIQHLDL